MSKCGEKFMLLMWKNFLLQWRHPIQTVIEILIPLTFTSLLVVFRSLAYLTEHPARIYTEIDIDYYSYIWKLNLVWSPPNIKLGIIIDEMCQSLKKLYYGIQISQTNITDSKSLAGYLVNLVNKEDTTWGYSEVLLGVQFDDSLASAKELPSSLNVTMRYPAETYAGREFISSSSWMTQSLFSKFQTDRPRNEYYNDGGPPGEIKYIMVAKNCYVMHMPNTAAIMAGIIWFLTFTPFSNLQLAYDHLTLAQKLGACILSNSAMGYGFQLVMMFEGIRTGVQWENIWESPRSGDELTLGHIFIMLLVDTVLYLLIAIYIEAIFPGEYGVPHVWYFPFTLSYWCGNFKQIKFEEIDEENTENKFYEKEPSHLEVGVKIQNLRKRFSKKNVALKNLSLNLYKDQITVLLGHNGAGKTTTMSMLTGMISPTSGTAVVGGHDIHTDIDGVRDSLGFCPQHNILFDDLTVRDHLYFYNRLKGLNKAETQKEIDKFLKLLELTDKGDAKSSTLSGGMKRKLSISIALCGNSKVVMCDEPSSGMDPSARRALWDLLKAQKQGRTILLTTHFMDEADLLGDRIAILSGGELQCCGSSYYLKKVYGAGYRLIMDKTPECEITEVTRLLKKYIPDIKVESCIGSELTYNLDEEKSSIFQEMLYDLETHSQPLGIESYGISITSFDEVFMKVSSSQDNEHIDDHAQTERDNHPNNEFQNSETKLNIHDHTYESSDNAYAEEYINALRSSNKELINWKEKDYIKTMIKEVEEKRSTVRMRYIVGASFQENNTIIALFNGEPYHSKPLSLQMALNSVLKKEVSTNHNLEFTLHPLPYSSKTRLKELESTVNNGFIITMNLSFALALVSSFYVMFYVRERVNNVKHLQFVSGVRVTAFWLSSFVCDILTFIFTSICIIVTFIIFQEENFKTAEELAIPGYYDLTEPGIGKNVLVSCLVGVVLFLILLSIDARLFDRLCYKIIPSKQSFDQEDDIDVAKEKANIRGIVQNGVMGKYDIIIHDITKYYKDLLAVNNICLGVNRYECFGLLGVNGAGKTTTFKMMTGDIKPSSGDAWINGLNLKSNMREVNKQIGYCPQFDALLDDLTCWETLKIFGMLRGITLKESKVLARKLAKDFDFYQHLHKRVKQLSGGNKRKLSTAIALIGDPLVIYLDEPTTGMDPATKRYLWNALCKIRDSGKCIILTSHSMEECEALCTRLAIMVNGNFKCIGSTQHLKSRFSEGYTLIIRIKKREGPTESHYAIVKSIENFVKENFRSAIIREEHYELLTFYIADRSQPWSKMFEIMERAKHSFDTIEDYSLGQSSLEQVL
ncbi:hypothetical protein ILUMI_11989 [Ignelater luminosus]|uniref:ABC transporter domain-containing protein n=1 Tax=Ignelater luminosus TaxID=2038154 RepID=A0A8K0CZH9_IGNLU|nr:hypothetical protein ILUMI_11989 [Ignelater luminosus]